VPADAILRRAINLAVDESLLTGESVPVRKTPSADAKSLERPGGDDLPSVFSGTLVTAGQGIAFQNGGWATQPRRPCHRG
jgi:P-type Ca2+ transporter type 2C